MKILRVQGHYSPLCYAIYAYTMHCTLYPPSTSMHIHIHTTRVRHTLHRKTARSGTFTLHIRTRYTHTLYTHTVLSYVCTHIYAHMQTSAHAHRARKAHTPICSHSLYIQPRHSENIIHTDIHHRVEHALLYTACMCIGEQGWGASPPG